MLSWFKRRDAKLFPADAYGDELYRVMQKDPGGEKSVGVDLTFEFASDADARQFAERIATASYTADVEETEEPGGAWIVETMRETQPKHTTVRALVEQMRSAAAAHQGSLSDWKLFW